MLTNRFIFTKVFNVLIAAKNPQVLESFQIKYLPDFK